MGLHQDVARRLCVFSLALLAGLQSLAFAACPPNSCCKVPGEPGTPACEKKVGDPVNVTSGNHFQQEVDLPALPGVLGLELVRNYNSDAAFADDRTILGRGWRLSYDEQLLVHDGGNTITAVLGDGTRKRYFRELLPSRPDETAYQATQPGEESLRARRAGGRTEYRLVLDGNTHVFDGERRLVSIVAPTGEAVSLTRDPSGALVRVTDPQGRSLTFVYFARKDSASGDRFRGVHHIDSPIGRFSYTYGSAAHDASADARALRLADLTSVALPAHFKPAADVQALGREPGATTSTVIRLYHYEGGHRPGMLTGISVRGQGTDGRRMDERVATWAHDLQGRAVLSVRGAYDPAKPGIEQVTLRYEKRTAEGGVTVLTNSLGQETRYTYAPVRGLMQLLQVRGAGCASCGPVNVRYQYDRYGRLSDVITMGSEGQPLSAQRTVYDGAHRPIRTGSVQYVNGKPEEMRWQVEFGYGLVADNRRPVRISQPSVVPGQQHTLHITYNEAGQPLQVLERGFSPINDNGNSAPAGAPIERTTRYTYARVNGRSLLHAFDGPLPNGPKGNPEDSDITQISWDRTGSQIDKLVLPGGRAFAFHYASAGWVNRVSNSDGKVTDFAYDGTGRLARLESIPGIGQAPRIEFVLYDALGRATELGHHDSKGHARPELALGFDVADRPQWQANRLGVVSQYAYDSESRLVRTGRFGDGMAQTLVYGFDGQGRLTQVRDASGAALRLDTSRPGRPPRWVDAYGEVSFGASKSPSSPDPTIRVADDFGRIVRIHGADSGTTLYRYDESDRWVYSRDAAGNDARYVYDLRGRILRQHIRDASSKVDTITQWRYEGSRLIRVEHPQQDEFFRYGPQGLLATKVTVQKAGQLSGHRITRYEWDEKDRLKSVSLPDGSLVTYERDGQGQVIAARRERLQTRWLRWVLPSQLIVRNLRRDLVGLKGYVSGNGIAAQYLRDSAGVLGRMVYSHWQDHVEGVAKDVVRVPHQATPTGPASSGTPASPSPERLQTVAAPRVDLDALLDHRYLWDSRGNLLLQEGAGGDGTGYAYDMHDRLIASTTPGAIHRYAYDEAGRRVLSQEGGKAAAQTDGTQRIDYPAGDAFRWTSREDGVHRVNAAYDPVGQPSRVGSRSYQWNPLGQLMAIREGERVIASYAYNHRGERIRKDVNGRSTQYHYDNQALVAEQDDQGRITRQYIYLADLPIAVIETPTGVSPAPEDEALSVWRDIKEILRVWTSAEEKLLWLHPNHLGAPELATNSAGEPVWQAGFAPFGKASIRDKEVTLNLRLPGQYFDEESGLHYNGHRYYDPQSGQYLSPDPLGPVDGRNVYAYAAQNPLRYVDPQGLMLFAFDGTGNDESDANVLSNVVKFRDDYMGIHMYITGVGTRDPRTGIANPWYKGGDRFDAAQAVTGPARVAQMFDDLKHFADDTPDSEEIPLDVIGFSRGAAEARDFTNKVAHALTGGALSYLNRDNQRACQKLRLRFLGLWDTVLSNHAGSYELAIPEQVQVVAQAVALNEYRPLFPLQSILGPGSTSTATRIERGFLGAHSDIGGGFPDGSLATVALAWMEAQAASAGVVFRDARPLPSDRAVLHDKSSALLQPGGPAPMPSSDDRTVRYSDGTVRESRSAVFEGMSYKDTPQFIAYKPNTGREQSGFVDMAAYVQWLAAHGYILRTPN